MKTPITGCPVEVAMQILGGRWRAVLIYYLLDGPKRFSDLRRDVPRISQRMLTLDLRELERFGLVRRTVYAEVPVRVEYELTPEGRGLRGIIHELCLWGKRLQRKPIGVVTRTDESASSTTRAGRHDMS
jgi:DNA-binding HxlR family transcriptional regulator